MHRRIQKFLKGGVGHRKAKKKNAKGSILCMFRGTTFSILLISLANGDSIRGGGGGVAHDLYIMKS